MSQYPHRTIIVPAAFQWLAQALCEAAAEGDGLGHGVYATDPLRLVVTAFEVN